MSDEYRNGLIAAEKKPQDDCDMTIVSLSGGALGISILDWARHDCFMPMCRVASISDVARGRRVCGTKESGATFRFTQSKADVLLC